MALSLPGVQKILNVRSMASSLPAPPRNICEAGKPFSEATTSLVMRVGVPVHAIVEWIFVGVDPDRYVASCEFVARGAVRLKREDVGAHIL